MTDQTIRASISGRLDSGAEWTLTREQEIVQVETLRGETVVDPDWSWVDPAGHRHAADQLDAEWVVTRVYWCEDCLDEHEESELRCVHCDVRVSPRWTTLPPQPQEFSGLTSFFLELRDRLPGGMTERATYLVTEQLAGRLAGGDSAAVDAIRASGRLVSRDFGGDRL